MGSQVLHIVMIMHFLVCAQMMCVRLHPIILFAVPVQNWRSFPYHGWYASALNKTANGLRYPSLTFLFTASILHREKCIMMPDLCCYFVFFKLFWTADSVLCYKSLMFWVFFHLDVVRLFFFFASVPRQLVAAAIHFWTLTRNVDAVNVYMQVTYSTDFSLIS